jgi:hypothetical protein
MKSLVEKTKEGVINAVELDTPINSNAEIIKEKTFIYDGKEYIARLYKPGDIPGVYGEILRDGARCEKMKHIDRDFLRSNGIELPNDYNTHDAVRKLINFREGKLK